MKLSRQNFLSPHSPRCTFSLGDCWFTVTCHIRVKAPIFPFPSSPSRFFVQAS